MSATARHSLGLWPGPGRRQLWKVSSQNVARRDTVRRRRGPGMRQEMQELLVRTPGPATVTPTAFTVHTVMAWIGPPSHRPRRPGVTEPESDCQ